MAAWSAQKANLDIRKQSFSLVITQTRITQNNIHTASFCAILP